MKKPFLFALAIVGFTAVSSFAADITSTPPAVATPAESTAAAPVASAPAATAPAATATSATHAHHSRRTERDWTLTEARQKAHKRLERAQEWSNKVDKMTEADWADYQKNRHARKEKLSKMTPEERKAYWEQKKEKYDSDNGESAMPSDTATPPQN